MSTNHKERSSELFNEALRVDRVIYLAGAISQGDSFPSDLEDFFEDQDLKNIVECLGPIPSFVDMDAKPFERSESVSEWLYSRGKFGYLVQMATPVMAKRSQSSRSFTWGHYYTHWFYGEEMDDAVRAGLAWAADMRAKEDAVFEKGGAA